MLKLLRKKGLMKKIIWAIAIVIIISFGFFGTAGILQNKGKKDYAGKIFGKKITFKKFYKTYQQTRIQAIIRYGDSFNNIREFLPLESETWDRLILLYKAKKEKITIADKDVIKNIQQYKIFHKNDVFSPSLYEGFLQQIFHIGPREFEEGIRDLLKIGELYKQVTASVALTEQEIFSEYKKQNEGVQISYVFIPPEQFKNQVSFNEEEAQQYYFKHREAFIIPPSINLQYISLPFNETEETSDSVTDNAITDGTENAASGTDTDDPMDKEIVKEKIENIFQDLFLNPNMREVAKNDGLEIKTSGFFSMEYPDLSLGLSYGLLDKVFHLELNEISEPFETSNNFYIVEIIEKRESFLPDYLDIKDKISEAVREKKAKEIARGKINEYLQSIKTEYNKSKIKDFPKITKNLGLNIFQTPVFKRGEYLPKIGISKEFQETAFNLNELNKISNAVETPNGFCILHLDDYTSVTREQYSAERTAFMQTLIDEKRNQAFVDFLTNLKLKANLIVNTTQKGN